MSDVTSRGLRPAFTRRNRLKFSGAGVALAGAGLVFSQPARAATKFRVLTNFYAEPGHGGIYQAKETGLYEKAGLDVEIKQGGPQINGMQLLTGGVADNLIGSCTLDISMAQIRAPGVVSMVTSQDYMHWIETRSD